MSKPTSEEIKAEVANLEACKAWAPKRDLFGTDNHSKIKFQIDYLKGDLDIDGEEWDDLTDEEQSAVLDAQCWEDGDYEESPSSGWDTFKPKA